MSTSVIITTEQPIEVVEPNSGHWQVSIHIDPASTIYLTTEQATKLCFDLLALVPSKVLADHVNGSDMDATVIV